MSKTQYVQKLWRTEGAFVVAADGNCVALALSPDIAADIVEVHNRRETAMAHAYDLIMNAEPWTPDDY